ncbi:beta-ketoacyl synthase [Podospora appendiculata]|uniref:Beta-ketoacyl synthase n=1 Tax=Podospora appendiculata TaxID=314037 RepID=A0AAE1CIQ3_9PEZI|nr:beta-ketoacyl synthase [Podospora appendiculata]
MRLARYGAEVGDGRQQLQISAVSAASVVSVSGPWAGLCVFRARAVADVATAFAHVHGWYHGGEQLEGVVQEVLQDCRRRGVGFSSCGPGMTKPIRSTLDGALFESSGSEELVAWLARHLLVHCVDWHQTAGKIAEDVRGLLEREPGSVVRIVSFGPSSTSLFPPDLQSFGSRVVLEDLSPFKSSGKTRLLSPEHTDSIAIVGMSVNLPRGKGTEQLWETLSQGLNAVQEIPESRFRVSDYHAAEDSHKPRTMAAKHGAFLDDPFTFDNAFFNISPREAKSMDPQQRVLLHAAQEALEDAGYVEDASPSFQRASIGCFVGLATGDYTDNLRDDIDVFYSPGTLRAFHSGRISYFYRLSGPSMVTDTACSSSTVSIYQACRALQNGDCTAAIAGGVHVITSPDMYLGLDRGHFLSPTGGCKPFDASADGYCRAEGCVLFVLKRLSDAVAEGDRIHGVIRDVVVNQSGNSHSITHPHSQTQIDLLNKLLAQTNVHPGSVGVVEAHGTGTQAGDAREVESLRAVFGPHHSAAKPLVLSSIKGNISHCEAASGAAGLAKLVLMLRERKLPVQVGLRNINPLFPDLEASGFVIPRQTMPWNHTQRTPRRAVLNNFGAAGSNASLLLEDWVESPKSQTRSQERSAYVFALSAKSERALHSAVTRHVAFLGKMKADRRPSLKDICYTATARRQVYDHRISLSASSVDDLLTKLQRYKTVGSKPAQKVAATVFVFSGQGAWYQGVGQELMKTSPPFKDIIMNCDKIIRGLGFSSILGMFSNDQVTAEALGEGQQIITSQCACIALEYALAKTFMRWWIIPDYVMGHSLGEYAALCVAGVLTLEDTFRMVATRAKLMVDSCLPDASGMLACNLAAENAQQIISQNNKLADLTIACQNGVADCVVGGPLDEIDIFQQDCKARKVRTKILDVPYAFHTAAMDPILEPLRELGQSVAFGRPAIPVMSNVHGRLLEDDDLTGDYFALHARQPVRFADGLLSLQRGDAKALDGALFLEIGPQPTTLPMLRSSVTSESCTYLGTLKKGQDAWTSISETLAAISLLKTPRAVNWREVFAGSLARVTSLPGHGLEGSKFMIPFKESRPAVDTVAVEPCTPEPEVESRIKTGFKLLPWLNPNASSNGEVVLETELAILEPLISGHDVGGSPICPASVFHELAVEAAQTVLAPPDTQVLVVNGFSFASPLVYLPSQESNIVMVRIRKHESSGADFKITSRSTGDLNEMVHCSGSVSMQALHTNASHWIKDEALVARQSRYFSGVGANYVSSFRTKVLYESIFTRVVKYSPEYRSLVYLNVADSNLEGIGSFEIPFASQTGYITHPVFTDTLLHAAGFVANLAVRSDEIGICSRVGSLEIAYRDLDYSDSFTIYCSLLQTRGAILADTIASNSAGKVVAVVRGMEFKRLRLSTFQQALSRKSALAGADPQPPPSPPPEKLHLATGLDTPPTSGGVVNSPIDALAPEEDAALHATQIRQALKNIVVEVGGFAEHDIDSSYTKSLDELGIDSLMQIEIVSKLARTFPNQTNTINHHALAECETLEALEDMLSSLLAVQLPAPRIKVSGRSQTSDNTTTPFPLSSPPDTQNTLPATLHTTPASNTPTTPLCLFHDGSGQVSMYARMRDHDRTTYGFFDPFFSTPQQRPHRSLHEMAAYYIAHLSHLKHTPLILGGWSFGGILAFETAHQLLQAGFTIRGLILIDAPSPVNHSPLPEKIIASILPTTTTTTTTTSSTSHNLRQEFLSNAALLGTYTPKAYPARGLRTVVLRSREVFDVERVCGPGARYAWLSDRGARDGAVREWEGLVGGKVWTWVREIPGNHFQAFDGGNIGETAAQIWEGCRWIEEAGDDTN